MSWRSQGGNGSILVPSICLEWHLGLQWEEQEAGMAVAGQPGLREAARFYGMGLAD